MNTYNPNRVLRKCAGKCGKTYSTSAFHVDSDICKRCKKRYKNGYYQPIKEVHEMFIGEYL